MKLAEIMTRDVITIQSSEPLGAAIQILHDNDIRHLPVLKGEELVGLISDRDIRHYRPPDQMVDENVMATVELLDTPLWQAMTSNVITLTPGDTIDRALDFFVDLRVGAICVVAGPRLVGIVSYVDVLRAIRDQRRANAAS
ncbi:MAG: CBS domain-containing protein [Myxococcales bacterium]|nr:CBS domain-containing protein [Myxococcales bacterium]MCB9569196.1 CBS domain-containing protein [Myxococcales bacterium]MCB9706065.1 CBS domain-containing protein [Myxococcales bacterium]